MFYENRKTSTELMRILAAVMVVFIHIRQRVYPDNGLAELAFAAVDFFFMATGFFTMLETGTKETAGISVEAHDAVLYSWKKAKRIFGLYFFAQVMMFVIRTIEKGAFRFSDILTELFHFKGSF